MAGRRGGTGYVGSGYDTRPKPPRKPKPPPRAGQNRPKPPPRPVQQPPRSPRPTGPNPMYDPYLDFSPTFRWGGRTYGANDAAAFQSMMGPRYAAWARNHPQAAKVFDPIEQRIYGMYGPELHSIEQQRKLEEAAWQRRMQNLTGFSAALMPYLQQVPGAIMGPYREGAAGVESAAAGYGGTLNADSAAEAAGANAVISGVGLPGQIQGGDAGGVLAGLGSMQAELMRSKGGAYGEAAKFLPQTASLEQLQAMRDLMHGAADADKGFQDKITEVLMGMPDTRAKIRQEMLAASAARQQQRLALAKFDADQHYKQYLIWKGQQETLIAQGRLKESQKAGRRADQELKLAQQSQQRLAMGSAGRDYWGNPKPGYVEAPNGEVYDPRKYRYNPRTGSVEAKPTGSKKGDSVFNKWGPSKRSTMASDARIWINQHKKDGYDYQDAYNYLYQKYLGYAGHGITQDELRHVVQAVLYAAGARPGPNGGGSTPGGGSAPPGYTP